jgi:hypothetical protein
MGKQNSRESEKGTQVQPQDSGHTGQEAHQLLDFDGKVGGDGTVGEGAVGGPSEAGAQQ